VVASPHWIYGDGPYIVNKTYTGMMSEPTGEERYAPKRDASSSYSLQALAISRPRGLLHLTGSMEEIAPLIAPPNPEPPNPVHDDSGQASLAFRVLDHEGLSTDMDVDSPVRERVTRQNDGVSSGSRSSREEVLKEGHRRAAALDGGEHSSVRNTDDKQPTFGHRDFSLPPATVESQSQQVVSNPTACSESAALGVGQPGPATCLVFEPSFDDVAQMLEGVLQGIVRALTSGSARLALTKELQAVVGHVDRSGIPHPKVRGALRSKNQDRNKDRHQKGSPLAL
jgi:hypothetical protein